MTRTRWLIAFVVLVSWAFALSLWIERYQPLTPEQRTARDTTTARELRAAKAETVYVTVRDSAMAARKPLGKLRDSILARPSDTAVVLRYVAKTDTLLRQDATALAAADSTIGELKGVVASKEHELSIALRPKPNPRFRREVGGYYEPLTGFVSASASASFRVIGGVSLVGRIDQRAAIGQRPELYAGIQLAF